MFDPHGGVDVSSLALKTYVVPCASGILKLAYQLVPDGSHLIFPFTEGILKSFKRIVTSMWLSNRKTILQDLS